MRIRDQALKQYFDSVKSQDKSRRKYNNSQFALANFFSFMLMPIAVYVNMRAQPQSIVPVKDASWLVDFSSLRIDRVIQRVSQHNQSAAVTSFAALLFMQLVSYALAYHFLPKVKAKDRAKFNKSDSPYVISCTAALGFLFLATGMAYTKSTYEHEEHSVAALYSASLSLAAFFVAGMLRYLKQGSDYLSTYATAKLNAYRIERHAKQIGVHLKATVYCADRRGSSKLIIQSNKGYSLSQWLVHHDEPGSSFGKKIVMPVNLNVKRFNDKLTAYMQNFKESRQMLDALGRIVEAVGSDGLKISGGNDNPNLGVCDSWRLKTYKRVSLDLTRLQTCFPHAHIQRLGAGINVSGLSHVDEGLLAAWLVELRNMERVSDVYHCVSFAAVPSKRSGKHGRRTTGGSNSRVLLQPLRSENVCYPDEFDFTDAHGATHTAHRIEGLKGVASYIAILVQSGPLYRADVVDVLNEWVQPARWGTTVRAITGASIRRDCSNPLAKTAELKGKATLEVRKVKVDLSEFRGVCRKGGVFAVPNQPELKSVPVHFCVDIARHSSKGTGFK
ncbi:MAG: hypothetical protein P1U34_08210 [Coxiellaceae bacterium]|nr:hypothetical protein [Coxiellaceae bacterium]